MRSVSTSISRPQGKKLLFVLPHSERDTEETTNAADGLKLNAELISREGYSIDVKSLCAELQLKNRELERVGTEVVERDTIIAKLQADLVEREAILREAQMLVSKCGRQLQGALETEFTACQNVFDRMQTRANDRPAAEEDNSSSTRKASPAAQSSPLSLNTYDSALRKEEQQLSGRLTGLGG